MGQALSNVATYGPLQILLLKVVGNSLSFLGKEFQYVIFIF